MTGEPNDMAGLAGTTLGDLFVFGDIRDAAREGRGEGDGGVKLAEFLATQKFI